MERRAARRDAPVRPAPRTRPARGLTRRPAKERARAQLPAWFETGSFVVPGCILLLDLIVAFIGVELVLHALHENEVPFINGGEHVGRAPGIPTFVSPGVIVAIIVVATIASMISPEGRSAHAAAELHRATETCRSPGAEPSRAARPPGPVSVRRTGATGGPGPARGTGRTAV